MSHRLLAAMVMAGVLWTLSGCTKEDGAHHGSSPDPQGAQTVAVARANIVGILTLKGTVVQGARFQVHAKTAGRVTAVNNRSITVVPPDGGPAVSVTSRTGMFAETLVQPGDVAVSGMTLAVAKAPGFTIEAELKPSDLLRFISPPVGARAQIDGGSGPFECSLADTAPTIGAPSDDGATVPQLFCFVPQSTPALAGMPATVVIQLEKADRALVLPVEAVAGTVKSGRVYVRGSDGGVVEKPVKLGTTDGVHIVIRDGLKEGDTVFVPGPWLGGKNG
jgi:hypothetical protein